MVKEDPNKEGRNCVVIKGVLVYEQDWVDVSWKHASDLEESSEVVQVTEVMSSPVVSIQVRNLDGEERVLMEALITKIRVRKAPKKKN